MEPESTGKSFLNKSIEHLQPYNDWSPKSTDENLTSLFRIMWNVNMLFKNVLNTDVVNERNNENNGSAYENITVKSIYKTIWKLNTLINYELRSDKSTPMKKIQTKNHSIKNAKQND